MATTEKPTALQNNLEQAEKAFSNLLTPEEEAPVEEVVEETKQKAKGVFAKVKNVFKSDKKK